MSTAYHAKYFAHDLSRIGGDGVDRHGASDEVLGTIESGVDFGRRVLDIYQTCRSSAEIQEAFEKLRVELDASIAFTIRWRVA